MSDRLARNLRRLRIARELSLSELARATAISKATLSSIEAGGANPTIDTLAGLADALRVPLADLIEPLPVPELRVQRATEAPWTDGARTLAGAPPITELRLGPRRLLERDPAPTGTWAHLYVIDGRLIAGPVERVTELTRGDYASFPADVPHQLETTRSGGHALLLITPGP